MTDSTGQEPYSSDSESIESDKSATEAATQRAARRTAGSDGRQFHGWRLLGVIFLVILAIAVVSAMVDWWVIGPLEGRAPWL